MSHHIFLLLQRKNGDKQTCTRSFKTTPYGTKAQNEKGKKEIRTGASPGTFSSVSGTARMVPAEAPKMLIGSKQSVPVDKTLKAALLSILKNVEGNSAKSNVFGSSKS